MQDPVNSQISICYFLKNKCAPLFSYLPMKNFSYVEIQASGNFIILSSNLKFYEEYIKRDYYRHTPFNLLSEFGTPGYYITDYGISAHSSQQSSAVNQYRLLLDDFNYGHTLLISKLGFEGNNAICRIYSFEAEKRNTNINQCYMNNIDIIEKFIGYIDKNLLTIRSAITQSNVSTQEQIQFNQLFNASINTASKILAKKRRLLSRIHFIDTNSNIPTTREMEVLLWYAKGKTAHETGVMLGISQRTVEKYFERMRKKFNCSNKSQLLSLLAEWISHN